MIRVNFYIRDDQYQKIKHISSTEDIAYSEIIRSALDLHFDNSIEANLTEILKILKKE